MGIVAGWLTDILMGVCEHCRRHDFKKNMERVYGYRVRFSTGQREGTVLVHAGCRAAFFQAHGCPSCRAEPAADDSSTGKRANDNDGG